jgi:hypothetical protein
MPDSTDSDQLSDVLCVIELRGLPYLMIGQLLIVGFRPLSPRAGPEIDVRAGCVALSSRTRVHAARRARRRRPI